MVDSLFTDLPLLANLLLFAVAASAIWLAGTRLSRYADAISDRMRIGKAFMGLVFLALATSLPEVVTTITAALENVPQLVLNNLFGGITMQTAILAIADAAVPAVALTTFPRRPTHALEGTLLMLLLALLLGVAALGELELFGRIGLGSTLLAITYIGVIVLLRSYDANSPWRPLEIPEQARAPLGKRPASELDTVPVPHLVRLSLYMTGVILFAGIVLVSLAEVIAVQSQLGTSFIGVTLLAASTSLPELSTTIAAVRLGSFTMAISNIFGSNLMMIALLLPADMFYRQGVLLDEIDSLGLFALISGIFVTGIYVSGLLVRQKRRLFGMGIDSIIVLAAYLASLVVFYHLR